MYSVRTLSSSKGCKSLRTYRDAPVDNGGRVLQTSTQYSSLLQTVCSMSSVVVSMAVLFRTFSSGICKLCNKNLKCSIK